jgi:hypothetical protein
MLHALDNLLSLSFNKSMTFLLNVVVVVGVLRLFIMGIQFQRGGESQRKFYPPYIPLALVVVTVPFYFSEVRPLMFFYPKPGFLVLALLVLLITALVVWQAVKYVRSLLRGGTTPAGKWYRAWPLRLRRGALPFTLTWVLSMLVLAIFFRELTGAMGNLISAGYVEFGKSATYTQMVADYSMKTADFFIGILPEVFVLWAVVTFVLFLGRKIVEGSKKLAGFSKRALQRLGGTSPTIP